MALALADAVVAVARLVGTISGLRGAPSEPPEKISVFPFALTYPFEGTYSLHARGNTVFLHTIVIEIHTARKDLPRDVLAIIPYGDLVAGVFLASANLRLPDSAGNPTVSEVVSPIRYIFGPLGYVNVPTLGYRFELEVKIQGV